jgi:CBS domain-containing protein
MPQKCSDVMTSDPKCCLPSDTVARAAQIMRDQDVGSVPVCEDERQKKLIGTVTDRDITLRVVAQGLDPNSTRIEQIMSRDVVTCRPEDDVEKAIQGMEDRQLRRIPVIDSTGRIVGIISQADIALRLRQPEKTAEVVEDISQPATRAGGGAR